MVKVLLFGSNGFLGHNIHDLLSTKSHIQLLAPSAKECDLRDYAVVNKYLQQHQPDFIINASFIGVDSKRAYSDQYLFDNILIQTNVMRASADLSCLKKIFVFGSGLECSDESGPVKELTAINPLNTYATIKAISTLLYKNFSREYKLPLVIVRLFNMYGKYDNKSVVYYLAHSILTHSSFHITKGEQIRDYTYCSDIAEMLYEMLDNHEHLYNGEMYNVASGVGTKLGDIFDQILKLTNYSGIVERAESPSNEYWHQVADLSKLRSVIKFDKYTPLHEGIQETIAWIGQSIKQ